MAMSSGKSSSIAAVLLVVALVAGTCASGAQARFNINFQCERPYVVDIYANDRIFAKALRNGGSVPVNASLFFVPDFRITFKNIPNPTTIHIPRMVLGELAQKGEELRKIEISCKLGFPICITLLATYQPPRGPPSPLGPFCARQ